MKNSKGDIKVSVRVTTGVESPKFFQRHQYWISGPQELISLPNFFADHFLLMETPNVLPEPLGGVASCSTSAQKAPVWRDVRLTTEVLKHAVPEFWEHLFSLYNDILYYEIVFGSFVLHFIPYVASENGSKTTCWFWANS